MSDWKSIKSRSYVYLIIDLKSKTYINIALHVIELESLSDYNRGLNSIFRLVCYAFFGKIGRASVCFQLPSTPARSDQAQFAYSLNIGCSPFSFFITFVSDRSFYKNRSARARFRLPCARARSDKANNFPNVSTLAVLQFHFCLSPLLL
jgi:hypothetical protein